MAEREVYCPECDRWFKGMVYTCRTGKELTVGDKQALDKMILELHNRSYHGADADL